MQCIACMNQHLISHGFFSAAIASNLIHNVKEDVENYLSNASYPTYTSDIHLHIVSVNKLIPDSLYHQTKLILDAANVDLESVELHYLPPCSEPIPPHQDNFYHCVVGGAGLKLLIPLTQFSEMNGGLHFVDCPSSIGVLPHVPSSTPNFSSFIPPDVLRHHHFSETIYDYRIGDVSYHLLNSIHSSTGNKSRDPVMFLVYRYQVAGCVISSSLLQDYKNTYQQHIKLIAQ